MKKLPFIFFLLCLFCSQFVLLADEPKLSVSLDRQTTSVNEEVHLNIKITGVRGNLQAPRLPTLESFEIFYSGRASHFSFINGRSESMTEFNYVLIPKTPGRFVIQPIEVNIEGRVYRTDQLEIDVEQNQTVSAFQGVVPTARQPISSSVGTPFPQAQPGSSQPMPSGSTSSQALPNDLDENIFLKVLPSQLTVYTNQQLLLMYSLFTRYDTRYEGFDEEPQTSGFWMEEFPMDQNVGRDTEMVGGKKYVRADVKKMALFPTAPGQYTIKPGTIKTSVQIEQKNNSLFDEFFNDSFFNGQGLFTRRIDKRFTPPPIQILVKPLPEAGKPPSFKGAVGDFRMSTTVDKRVVDQNQAVTLQMTIEGEGNIETLTHPEVPAIQGTKIYDSDTKTQLFRLQNVIAGKKTFEILFIPSEAGELSIPSLEFSFFNPKLERYVVLKSDPYQIKVNTSLTPPPPVPQGVLNEGLGNEKKTIHLESEDIQYIKEKILSREHSLLPTTLFWLTAVDIGITVLCLTFFAFRKREEYLDQNVSLKRMLFAKRNAVRGLKHLEQLAKSSKEPETFFEESAKALNQYLAGKLNLSPQGLTQRLIETKLKERGATLELIQKIQEVYEQCDLVRFGRIDSGLEGRAAMLESIKEIISRMD